MITIINNVHEDGICQAGDNDSY